MNCAETMSAEDFTLLVMLSSVWWSSSMSWDCCWMLAYCSLLFEQWAFQREVVSVTATLVTSLPWVAKLSRFLCSTGEITVPQQCVAGSHMACILLACYSQRHWHECRRFLLHWWCWCVKNSLDTVKAKESQEEKRLHPQRVPEINTVTLWIVPDVFLATSGVFSPIPPTVYICAFLLHLTVWQCKRHTQKHIQAPSDSGK